MPVSQRSADQVVRLVGMIMPASGWGRGDGQPAVSLITSGNLEYGIVDDRASQGLRGLVYEQVALHGKLADGVVKVVRFEVLSAGLDDLDFPD